MNKKTQPMPPVALLAGGLAKRLRPITDTIPKAMVEVAGEPFINHQLRLLKREGIDRVVILAGYRGSMIQEHVKNGAQFGLSVSYSFDGDKLLGTGGAIVKSLAGLGTVFWVMYGDSYLDIPLRPVLEEFNESTKPCLMTVLKNNDKWDTSNVIFENGIIKLYDKKKVDTQMKYVDYGLSIFKRSVFEERPEGLAFDLAEVLNTMSISGNLAGYEVNRRFYEIGSVEGLRETQEYILKNGG